MMQDGLHIGLAAWIHRQQNTGCFLAWPRLPIATALVEIEAIQDISDLAKAAEFASLVNFIPRQGQLADVFSGSAVLWRVHRDILSTMDHAKDALTSTEQARYKTARDVLYTADANGLPTPSQKLLFYDEMKTAYQDLCMSGGSQDEIDQAMVNWVVLGYKQSVEDAFEEISELLHRSSRSQAQNEALLLNEDPPGVGLRFFGDLEFAPTYFAPISAIDHATWMTAKVSFADLDSAVDTIQQNDAWKAYRANRDGEVLFDYIVLKCIRPWYTVELYRMDDWRLNTEDVVSRGNGFDGLMPAYVDAVYLVAVQNITTKSMKRLSASRQTPHLIGATNVVQARLSQPVLRPKSVGDAGQSMGVVPKAVNTPFNMRRVLVSSRSKAPLRSSDFPTPSTANEHFTDLEYGKVKRVTASDLYHRYMVAQTRAQGTDLLDAVRLQARRSDGQDKSIPAQCQGIVDMLADIQERIDALRKELDQNPGINPTRVRIAVELHDLERQVAYGEGVLHDCIAHAQNSPPENATASETYVAGFGCEKIPFAPNPNVNYHW